MMRGAVALCLILLPVAAATAQVRDGALGPMGPPGAATTPEAMSRAQIAQMIADRGYFEMGGLTPQRDGSWTCTALAGPGRRVALTIERNGTILQKDLPPPGAQ